jgi:hypothetical protein
MPSLQAAAAAAAVDVVCLQHMQGKALPIVKLCDWGYSKLAEAGPRTAVVSAAAAVHTNWLLLRC